MFRELESAYRLLAGKYRSLNLQRAANHQYLEALVEHVSVALICLDGSGAVTLMNREAKALFKTPHLASLKSFGRIDPSLPTAIEELADGGRALISVKIADEALQLALFATEFELLGERYKLISFQNIRDELEQREIDYSQKLIKVLTHEIMNSVTPIISLTKLIRDRLVDEKTGELDVNLDERRATRSGARPRLDPFARQRVAQVRSGLQRVDQPAAAEPRGRRRRGAARSRARADGARARGRGRGTASAGRRCQHDGARRSAADRAGADQSPKNAAEALAGRDDGSVPVRGARDDHGKVLIQVIDNGPGIDAAHLDNIFLPFFTTKRSGSGVGLSVSRQIMALNKGMLTVKTALGAGSEFTLRFR